MQVLSAVISFIADQNVDAYFVGGLVRDELLGRTVKRDIDVAISGSATDLARAFGDAYGGAFYLMDDEHDVARVILRGTEVDFAGLRGVISQDLETRDFTINAMARRMGGTELIDPFHGADDLRDRIVRAVSDDVFKNDPVRLLRAIRFVGEFDFDLDAHTRELIQRDAKLLEFASIERARDELMKILALPNAARWLRRADSLGLLSALVPEMGMLKTTAQTAPHVFSVFDHTMRVLDELERIQEKGYVDVAGEEFASELQKHFSRIVVGTHSRGVLLRLAGLVHDIAKPLTRSVDAKGEAHFIGHEKLGAEMVAEILRRLRFSKDEVELVRAIVLYHLRASLLSDEIKVTNRAVYKFFRDAGDAGIDLCALSLGDRRGTYAAETQDKNDARLIATQQILLGKYFRASHVIIFPPALVDGHGLMQALKLEPGRKVGELLEAIREEQADGNITTREQALAFARMKWERESRRWTRKRRKISPRVVHEARQPLKLGSRKPTSRKKGAKGKSIIKRRIA